MREFMSGENIRSRTIKRNKKELLESSSNQDRQAV
nr:MAG TPA: hypothetical protein [Caudoviricetes sp.]